jgi:biotin carboxyl carrier protein
MNPANLTIDSKKLLNLTTADRIELPKTQEGLSFLASLTPSQLAQLFPDYTKKGTPDAGVIAAAEKQRQTQRAMSGYTPAENVPQPKTWEPTRPDSTPAPMRVPQSKPIEQQRVEHQQKKVEKKEAQAQAQAEAQAPTPAAPEQKGQQQTAIPAPSTSTTPPGKLNPLGEARTKAASTLTADQKIHMFALTAAEVGTKNEAAQRALMETIFNRQQAQGLKSLADTMTAGYYEPLRPHRPGYQNYLKFAHKLRNDPEFFKKMEEQYKKVIEGSNDSDYGTHNSSAAVADSARRTQTITRDKLGGETFSRKDRAEFARQHGAGTVMRESRWFRETQREMIEWEKKRTDTIKAATESPRQDPNQTGSAVPTGPRGEAFGQKSGDNLYKRSYEYVPNTNDLPGNQKTGAFEEGVVTHVSGFPVGTKDAYAIRQAKKYLGKESIDSTTDELEMLKRGADERWGRRIGYHAAIVSNYYDKDGNKIDETAYDKLSAEQKKNYTERGEIHELRGPNKIALHAGNRNSQNYGLVRVGRQSEAKNLAAREHLATLAAQGSLSEAAATNVRGHGELPEYRSDPRASYEGGRGEGYSIAAPLRRDAPIIKERIQELKAAPPAHMPVARATPTAPQTSIPLQDRAMTGLRPQVATPVPKAKPVEIAPSIGSTEMPIPEFEHGGERQAQGDNATVVGEQGTPLFKMNTDKERMTYDPASNNLKVEPTHRTDTDALMDKHNELQDIRESLADMQSKQQSVPQAPPAPQQSAPHRDQDYWNDMMRTMAESSGNIYETASFHRAVAKSRFIEVGDAVKGGHHSYGASTLKLT